MFGNRYLDKKTKYTLEYTPDLNIPDDLYGYIKMVVRRDPLMWGVLILTDIIHGIRYPLSFVLMGLIIDALIGLPPGGDVPAIVWQYAGAMFAVLLIGELAHALPHYLTFDWWKRAGAELRSDLMAYTLGHSFTYFQNHFAGSLSRKITEGIAKAMMLNEQIRWQILLPLVSMVSSGVLLLEVSWLYGALVCLFLAAIMLPVILKLDKLREKSRIFSDATSDVTGQIVDSLTNIASVKSFAHEGREMAEHRRVSEVQMKAWHKMLRAFLLLDNYRRLTLVLFGGGMMVACILGWQRGLITVGEIATIMGIAFNFTGNAWHLSFGIIHVMESLGYLNDTLTTLIKPHAIRDEREAETLRVSKGRIVFDHVDFAYAGQPVFRDLDIRIEPGQRIGLIGPSGAGKSTFVNLIQRFFEVNDGQITIDGQNIAEVTQQSLRREIAVIPQDTALFHRTLMDNIRYGRLDASDEAVIEAAQKAHAMEFIREMPQGLQTLVGERGVKLSGGQRQRIAIARAILKNAPILILDEATSALDSESEKLLQDSLEELMEGKTVIAVAHRLSTISHLDRLLVMKAGEIIEDGAHQDLLEKQGLYAKLWAMQSGGFLPKNL